MIQLGRRRWASVLAFLAVMGPGIITGFAGNDAGGVTTYSAVGAHYGFALLWLLLVSTVGLVVVQEMCARMGAVTGKGLSDLIRENFGVRWTMLGILALLVANGSNVVAEFAGIAASLELLSIPRVVSVPIAAAVIWAVVVFFDYKTVERTLFVLVRAFVAYPVTALIVHPDWAAVARSFVVPSIPAEQAALVAALALVGTNATLLFGVGLFAASALAALVLPLSTAYAVTEAFGWESGISKRFGEAPIFMGLFTFLILAGAAVVALTKLPLIPLIVLSQDVQGLLLPVVLFFIVRLAGDRVVMKQHANGAITRTLGVAVAVLASVLSLALVAVSVLSI